MPTISSPRTRPARRATQARRRAVGLVAVAALTLGACSTSGTSSSTSSTSTTSATSATATNATGTTGGSSTGGVAVTADIRGRRYCEVLLVTPTPGKVSADVYNTFPLNACPPVRWKALRPRVIAAREGVPAVVLNGPRYWLMDHIIKQRSAAMVRANFGGIEMIREANVVLGTSVAAASAPYSIHPVDRATVFTYSAGRTVYELTAPGGITYVMQSWSQQVDPTLTEAQLPRLGSRLHLPAGWTYRTRTLSAPLRVVTTTTSANVLQDELKNSYSQETTG